MVPEKFYQLVRPLGEFRCNRDLRRFNHRAKRHPNWNANQYLSHFGFCKNGVFHHCDFVLATKPIGQVIYYYKMDQLNGIAIRRRGGKPMNLSGRGRPPVRHISKKR